MALGFLTLGGFRKFSPASRYPPQERHSRPPLPPGIPGRAAEVSQGLCLRRR